MKNTVLKSQEELRNKKLVEIIKQELNDKNQLTPAEEAKIDKMSVIPLQRYAIDHDIKASIELKKKKLLNISLKNAKETKEKYFVPTNPGVYNQSNLNSIEPLIQPEEEITRI